MVELDQFAYLNMFKWRIIFDIWQPKRDDLKYKSTIKKQAYMASPPAGVQAGRFFIPPSVPFYFFLMHIQYMQCLLKIKQNIETSMMGIWLCVYIKTHLSFLIHLCFHFYCSWTFVVVHVISVCKIYIIAYLIVVYELYIIVYLIARCVDFI